MLHLWMCAILLKGILRQSMWLLQNLKYNLPSVRSCRVVSKSNISTSFHRTTRALCFDANELGFILGGTNGQKLLLSNGIFRMLNMKIIGIFRRWFIYVSRTTCLMVIYIESLSSIFEILRSMTRVWHQEFFGTPAAMLRRSSSSLGQPSRWPWPRSVGDRPS